MLHTTFVQIALFDWLTGRHKGLICGKKYSKFFFPVTVRRMKLKIGILALDIALYKSYDFYSSQIGTLVAMATNCFHRLIIWKFQLFHCG